MPGEWCSEQPLRFSSYSTLCAGLISFTWEWASHPYELLSSVRLQTKHDSGQVRNVWSWDLKTNDTVFTNNQTQGCFTQNPLIVALLWPWASSGWRITMPALKTFFQNFSCQEFDSEKVQNKPRVSMLEIKETSEVCLGHIQRPIASSVHAQALSREPCCALLIDLHSLYPSEAYF